MIRRVLGQLGVAVVALGVLVCAAGAVAVPFLAHRFERRVVVVGDRGGSIGYLWFQGELQIRLRGFGPGEDVDVGHPIPLYLSLLSWPPFLWMRAQRPLSRLPRLRRAVAYGAGACPVLAGCGAVYGGFDVLRWIAGVFMPALMILGVAAAVCWGGATLLDRRLSLPERRRARGLCENCGYDLRESPHRCPECGRARSIASDDVPRKLPL